MANFTISQERIEDAVNVIVQFLNDAGYEGSLEDGTGLNDVVVRPNAIIYELFNQLVNKASAYQSLQKALELRDDIGEEDYDAAVDAILSNWFVTRNDGKPSTGVIRMWFLKPIDFMHFTDGQEIGTVDSTTLVADTEQVFTEESFSYILNTAENENEYYVDVAVRTEENSDIAPSAEGSHNVSVAFNDIYYLRATIPGTFTAGTIIESSEDFIRRAEQAITTRELITARAINTVLLDEFADIIRLYVARHGSSEQLRDIVEFQRVIVHVGNKADIYIASEITKQNLVVDAVDGNINTDQLPSSLSVIYYLSAKDADGNELPLNISCVEETWCSNLMLPTTLNVGTYTGKVTLTLLTDTVLGQVHNFVYSDEQRVACYDPMVKHMFPLVMKITLEVSLVDKTIKPDDDVKHAILEYMKYIVVHAEPWVASELVASVHVYCPNVKKINLPIQCTGYIYDPKKQVTSEIPIGNRFTVNKEFHDMHSAQITDNTVQFYTDADLITVVSDYAD